ncbi:hypothetical protein BJX62DRAFT_233952 [Aspergillus germanicus]
MAQKTASRIRFLAPNRESTEPERSDTQTAKVSSPAPADIKRQPSTERKRKAIEPPDSPPDSRGRSSSNEAQYSGDCEPEMKQQGSAASVVSENTVDGQDLSDSDGETKQRIASAEPFDQRYWADFNDIGFRYIPSYPSAAAAIHREDCRTLAHECIDLFVKEEYDNLESLLKPLVQPIAAATFKTAADTFEAFLSRAEIHLRLKRVTNLGGRIYQFSDVEDFGQLTKRVYKVTIGGKAVVYKKAKSYYAIRREITGLQALGLSGLIALMTLHLDFKATSTECKQWFDDISAAILGLHRYDWAYGDVKPGNVLIEDDRHAWLINFEGRFTPDWVDESPMDTIPGDLQGLERLQEYLGLEEPEVKDEPQTSA